jgi:hypothetical protein
VPSRSKPLQTIKLKSPFLRILGFTYGSLWGRVHCITMGV